MEGQHHGQPGEETPPGILLTIPHPTCARFIDPRGRGTVSIRPALRRCWYSGDLLLIPSCRCLIQLWWPLRGDPAVGAQQSEHVAAACGARDDIPHRTHHQRACPGASGCKAKWPRMPGAVRAMSRGRTCRVIPDSSVWPGPGLGSTSPQVASDPRPEVGEGPADVVVGSVGRGGMGGRG